MISLKRPISFEWDEGNLTKNWLKHQVAYQEAEEVFSNEPLLLLVDSKHSVGERRLHALGRTDLGKLFFISFTFRGENIRVISVRPMNKKERRLYLEVSKEKTE